MRRYRARETPARLAYLLLASLLLVAGLAVTPAHADGSAGHAQHESPAVTGYVLAAAVVGTVFAMSCRRRRQAAILALGLLVGWFGLESAIHSVHHFSDPQSAASCSLFQASQHADGTGPGSLTTETPTWTDQLSPTLDDEQVRPLQSYRFYEGRAPPVFPSA
jgi:hypothetical protein